MSDSKLEKISAYIPKKVKEKLKKVAKKENISVSQAVAGALVKAYDFEDLEVGRASKRIVVGADTETKKRVENLENKLDKVTQLLEQMLPQKDSNSSSNNGALVGHEHVIAENNCVSEKLVDYEQITIDHDKILKNQSKEKVPNPLPQEENSKQLTLASELNIEPLTGSLLSSRLGVHASKLSSVKKNYPPQEFENWSAKKDPNNIAWIPNEGRRAGYSPSEKITGEQLSKLKEWLVENS